MLLFLTFLCGETDCHVASLLAMTCKRLSRCYVCKRVLPGQARNRPRIRPTSCLFLPVSAGKTDCRVAPLLAMTCRNLRRVCVCQGALPGKSIGRYEFALSTANFYPSLRGCGLPRRFAPRNDMQKIVALLRVQEGAAGASPQPPTNSP